MHVHSFIGLLGFFAFINAINNESIYILQTLNKKIKLFYNLKIISLNIYNFSITHNKNDF